MNGADGKPLLVHSEFNEDTVDDEWAFLDADGTDSEDGHDFSAVYHIGDYYSAATIVNTDDHAVDFDYLVQRNSRLGTFFSHPLGALDPASWRLSEFVAEFIEHVDPQVLWMLVKWHDPNSTVRTLYPEFREYCITHWSTEGKRLPDKLKQKIDVAAELLALAVQNCREKSPYPPKIITSTGFFPANLLRPKYALRHQLRKEKEEASDRMRDAAIEAYFERRDQYASKTRHHEQNPSEPIPVKVRAFMNALRERNAAGAFIDHRSKDSLGIITSVGVEYRPLIIFRESDREKIESVFERYPGSSVEDILHILHLCVRVSVDEITGRDSEMVRAFHASRGHIIAFFCEHIDEIVDELSKRYWKSCEHSLKR